MIEGVSSPAPIQDSELAHMISRSHVANSRCEEALSRLRDLNSRLHPQPQEVSKGETDEADSAGTLPALDAVTESIDRVAREISIEIDRLEALVG